MTFKKGLKDKSEEKEPPPKKSRKKRATRTEKKSHSQLFKKSQQINIFNLPEVSL